MRRNASTYVGERFGKLVITATYRENRRTYVVVVCDCGVTKSTRLDGLQSGATVSCGCHSLTQTSLLNKKHGMYNTPTYRSWDKMKRRCTNAEYEEYYSNISYEEDWEVFENFLRDMGERPEGCTLDRVDNSKGYSKDNCMWRSASYQLKNQRKRLKGYTYSDYKGVSFDHRYKGSYTFSVTKDYKTLRGSTGNDEIKAAMYFNFCTKWLYGDQVELNDVNDLLLKVAEADVLCDKLQAKFDTY